MVLLRTSALGKVMMSGAGLHILAAPVQVDTGDTAPPGKGEAVRVLHLAVVGTEGFR